MGVSEILRTIPEIVETFQVWPRETHIHNIELHADRQRQQNFVKQIQMDWTSPKLSRLIRWYLYWLHFLMSVFCHYSYTWAVKLVWGVFHLFISLNCWLSIRGVFFCVFWSFQRRRISWSRRWGVRRYHNSWCIDTLWGLFEHVPVICLFHWWNYFFE